MRHIISRLLRPSTHPHLPQVLLRTPYQASHRTNSTSSSSNPSTFQIFTSEMSSPAPKPKPAPTAVRPSASLILVSPTNRLLLLHRPAYLSFPGAHVFPGGVLNPSDPSPRFAAARESFEETGILLTRTPPPSGLNLIQAQTDIHNNTLDFSSWLASWGGELILSPEEVLPFSTWTTPGGVGKRFRNEFFVARLPEWCDETVAGLRGDGGKEVVTAKWWTVEELMQAVEGKSVRLFPPQLVLSSLIGRGLERGGWDGVKEVSRVWGEREVVPKMRRQLGGEEGVELELGGGVSVRAVKEESGFRAVGLKWEEEAGVKGKL